MASNGLKGNENGKQIDSEESSSSPEYGETVCDECGIDIYAFSNDNPKLCKICKQARDRESVCEKCGIDFNTYSGDGPKLCKICKQARDREMREPVARELFPKPRFRKYAGSPFSPETIELMKETLKRMKQQMKEEEDKKTQQKSCEEKRKIEKLEESQNTPSNSESEDAKLFEGDRATTTNQPKLSKVQKTEVGSNVHQKRCEETQAENVELQSKKVLTRKVDGQVVIDTYPRAPTEGLPGFSQPAIMQDINLCDQCDCTQEEQPCMQCRSDNWHCKGTCTCCEVQRNLEEAMKDLE